MKPARSQQHILPALCAITLATGACQGGDQKPKEEVPEALATVTRVEGEVLYLGKPLRAGQTISLNETVEVRDGRATLMLPDIGEVRLFPSTSFQLANRSKLRLLLGKVWCFISRAGGTEFEVETSNAVAGVRGTEFLVEIAGGETQVAVVEGTVEVVNVKKRSKSVRVKAGLLTRVTKEEPPIPPTAFNAQPERDAWKTIPTTVDTPSEVPDTDGETGAIRDNQQAIPAAAPRKMREKSQLERESDKAKQQIQEEAQAAEAKLKEESKKTREDLAKEEEKTRKELKKKEQEVKDKLRRGEDLDGGVKDFLK